MPLGRYLRDYQLISNVYYTFLSEINTMILYTYERKHNTSSLGIIQGVWY
jgi:hypothetical protein